MNKHTTHRCFCCGAATALESADATAAGWEVQPHRGIAASPAHSVSVHDVNLARIAHSYGKAVEELYRGPALPVGADHMHRPALSAELVSRDQAECWAGRALDDEDFERLSEAIPNSSIPDAIDTIVASWPN